MMNVAASGDLAQVISNRLIQGRLKGQMQRLGQELSTGRRAAPALPAADVTPLAAMERSLVLAETRSTVAAEFRTMLEVAQRTLGNVAAQVADLPTGLLEAGGTGDLARLSRTGAEARLRFNTIVNNLNTQVGGRSIFAGVSSNGPALAPAHDIMSELEADVSGATTAADALAAVEAYFASGGGFESRGYVGGAPQTPARLSPNAKLPFAVTADNPDVRKTLSATAKAALLETSLLLGAPAERAAFARAAGNAMLEADSGLVDLRARVGASEAQVETAQAQLAAEKTSLEIARQELVGADPYDTAARLSAVEAQLDAFYTLSSRLSRLTLTEYLR